MKKLNEQELNQVLKEHEKWLKGEGGACANLDGVDLSGVDLSDENLAKANLSNTWLIGADLSFSNLEEATLDNAIIEKANLSGANLSGASLVYVAFQESMLVNANLFQADLRKADFKLAKLMEACLVNTNLAEAVLTSADLQGASLRGADLDGAYLNEANLTNVILDRANLRGADLCSAKLDGVDYSCTTAFFALQCPEVGSFTAFKKADDKIIELEVPASAKRSSATTRKCRCDKAKVVSITSPDGKTSYLEAESNVDPKFIYRVGEMMEVPDFDEDRWNECSAGIHFFPTRQEAVNY